MIDLEVEIIEVANIVEQTIQLRVTEVVLENDENKHERLSDTLQLVAEDIDCIRKESTKIQDKGKQVSEGSLVHDFSSSTNNILNVNYNMVGRDDQKEHLIEDLTTSYPGEPKVIPIVGMGGIGKTTLAKEVYNHESILRRFDVRSWATVSQRHNIKEILLSLLQSTIKMDDTDKTKGEAELADMLQKILKRKRYLIVLDDIWSCEVWDGVRQCFRSEDNAGKNLSLRMSFMDQDESWSLFKSAAFSSEALPYEFETVGKQIADECHGLPLTIVVVAGLLNCKRAIYNHLTSNLKTCLLHFGIFPEDSEIPAKGFLKLENDLEGEAEKCLQELVDRCLVLISKKSLDGTKIRSCKVHDLIYDLCMREIQRENIFIMNDILIHFKLLKVLELRHGEIDDFPLQLLSLIWLRYLSLQCHEENLDIPPEICRLWNLQTFIVQGPSRSDLVTFPEEIWGLMQLRNLKLPEFYLPNPPSISADKGSHMGFSNIQTISYLSPRCCTKEVIMGIQNVKELGISACEFDSNRLLNNLVHLQQLETLSLTCFSRFLPASAKAFPATLKKLKLERTWLSWLYLDIIAELPNLEVLKLVFNACDSEEWHPNVNGFTRLKVLLINKNYLEYWKATNDIFPVLERLMIRSCRILKEIPIEFADIHTLQLIDLKRCLPKFGESAARIQKEQEDLRNNPVDVRISDPSC
ncbi:hypothetical protein P3S68_008744 [Capsicum galapagoense]